jgi:hypothetical protein
VKQELNETNEEIFKLRKAKELGLAQNDYSIKIKNLMKTKKRITSQ